MVSSRRRLGGAHSPVRPILLLAVRPGGAGKASPGLSLGANAGLIMPPQRKLPRGGGVAHWSGGQVGKDVCASGQESRCSLGSARSPCSYDGDARSARSYIAKMFASGVSGWMWCELHRI
jgi:hypothetical protein